MLEATHWTELGFLMEKLETRLKELKGFTTHRKNNNINQPDPPELTGVLMEASRAPSAYVAEDGLIRYQ